MSLHRGSTSETAHHHEFFRPTSALWWLYLSACLACSSATVIHFGATIAQVKYSLLTLLPFYLASGLFFFWIVLLCDPYRARRPWVMFAAFVGGAGITLYPAMKGNNLYPAFLLHIMSEEKALAWMPAIAGPTTEEWTKMACTLVIMLIAKSTLTRPIHGLLIGACVGLGFQILENIVYGIEGSIGHLQGDLTQSTSIGISRFATGFASHNLFTAISGVGVAVLLGRTVGERWSRSRRIATFLGSTSSAGSSTSSETPSARSLPLSSWLSSEPARSPPSWPSPSSCAGSGIKNAAISPRLPPPSAEQNPATPPGSPNSSPQPSARTKPAMPS